MSDWYTRPVLFVADIGRSVEFYVDQLGFTQSWRHEDEGKALVAQVNRQGCELILSSQWPNKVGSGLIFISLDVGVLHALRADATDFQEGGNSKRLNLSRTPRAPRATRTFSRKPPSKSKLMQRSPVAVG